MLNKPVHSVLLLVLACTFVFSSAGRSQQSAPLSIERNVAMKTRDGVTLRADMYRPAGEGSVPGAAAAHPLQQGQRGGIRPAAVAARIHGGRAGRARAIRIRGRVVPFKHESDDGYDTVEWAAALPGSNGKVGMFGGSYVGATQMLAAIGHPPHLAGICPVVTASNYHENWTYQGGAFEQWFNESWTSGLAQDTVESRRHATDSNAVAGSTVLPLKKYPLYNMQSDRGSAPVGRRGSRLTSSIGSLIPPTTAIGSSGPSTSNTPTSRFLR